MSPDRGGEGSPVKSGELLARQIRARIACGDLAPGDHLPPEDELMVASAAARTTVREALRILEAQGLIEIRRGRRGGGRVIEPSIEHLAEGLAVHLQLQGVTYGDLEDARLILEPGLVNRLARTRTDDDLAALEEGVARAADAARSGDRQAMAEAITAFHRTIIDRAGNLTLATLTRLGRELTAGYYSHVAGTQADAARFERAVRSYRKLVRLVADRQAEEAEAHWRRMLETIGSAQDPDEPIRFIR